VHVHDDDPAKLVDLPAGVTGHTDKAAALGHAEVLISCVGQRTLFPEDIEALPANAVLVNAASSNDELGADALMTLEDSEALHKEGSALWSVFDGKPLHLGVADADANHDVVLRTGTGKQLLLAKAGYVVNLTGDRDPIPPWHIQLTRALLFAAAISAFRIKTPGVHDVPLELQEAIVHIVERELTKRGLDTKSPRFGSGGQERALDLVPTPAVPERLLARLPGLVARSGG
jgi:S-adenosylhomocysteine hydrolase